MKCLTHVFVAASLVVASGCYATSAHAATNGISSVYGTTRVSADGVSAVFASYKVPSVYIGDYSVGQVRAGSADLGNLVEAGWIVQGGDYRPHLFVDASVNGKWDGYNLAGHFVWTDRSITPGGLLDGASGEFSVIHWGSGWWVGFGGTWFGYYPDDLWGGGFTKAAYEGAGGEVYSHSGQVGATQMGSGQIGGKPGAAQVSKFTLYGADSPPPVAVEATDPLYYNAGNVGVQDFDFGGAGPSYS